MIIREGVLFRSFIGPELYFVFWLQGQRLNVFCYSTLLGNVNNEIRSNDQLPRLHHLCFDNQNPQTECRESRKLLTSRATSPIALS